MDVTERRREQDALRELNAGLEARVAARTTELDQANRALALEVAERSSMLAEVKRSEARLRALTHLSADWFWEQGADLRFVQIVSGDSDLPGLPADAHIGALRWELPYTDIDGGDWGPHQALVAARQPFRDLLLRRALPSGERFVQVSGTPHHAPDGSFAGYLGIARDVTHTKRAELELIAARDAADAANRAKSEFLAAMSHEIRTPMNGVIGMLEVLQQAGLSGEQVEIVDVIRESAFGLLAIIEDILDFSKIEAGKMEVEREPLQLAEIVEKACAMLAPTAARAKVALTVFVDPAIPDSMLGDAGRLRQVLLNLLSNAIKFSAGRATRGRVAVRARLVERLPGCASVELSVADNGIGIDAPALARLFRPFAQADSSTTRRYGGTGLGLAISKTLMELMAGQIDVRSEPNAGSTFTLRLTLPLHDEGVAIDDGRNRYSRPAVPHCRQRPAARRRPCDLPRRRRRGSRNRTRPGQCGCGRPHAGCVDLAGAARSACHRHGAVARTGRPCLECADPLRAAQPRCPAPAADHCARPGDGRRGRAEAAHPVHGTRHCQRRRPCSGSERNARIRAAPRDANCKRRAAGSCATCSRAAAPPGAGG